MRHHHLSSFAATYPDRTRALILCDASVTYDGGVTGESSDDQEFERQVDLVRHQWGRPARWAPPLNVVLFSLDHFWSPWQFFSRVAGVTPCAYAVWRKENVYLGMIVHGLLNTISVATVAALVLGELR